MAKIATDLTLAELKRVRLLFSGVSYIVAREIVRRSVVTVPVWRDDDGGVWIDKEVTRWLNSVVVKRTRIYLNKNTPENVQGMKAAEFLEQVRFKLHMKNFHFVVITCFLFAMLHVGLLMLTYILIYITR